MLVAIPLLAGDGSLITAIRQSVVKSSIALGAIGLIGRYALNPVFKIVASSKSQVCCAYETKKACRLPLHRQ